jgi:hypothetical protein
VAYLLLLVVLLLLAPSHCWCSFCLYSDLDKQHPEQQQQQQR